MKKFQSLGKILGKDEQKKIIGGSQVVCTCKGSDLDTTVCAYRTITGAINCTYASYKYCTDNGYSGTTCIYGSGPQN